MPKTSDRDKQLPQLRSGAYWVIAICAAGAVSGALAWFLPLVAAAAAAVCFVCAFRAEMKGVNDADPANAYVLESVCRVALAADAACCLCAGSAIAWRFGVFALPLAFDAGAVCMIFIWLIARAFGRGTMYEYNRPDAGCAELKALRKNSARIFAAALALTAALFALTHFVILAPKAPQNEDGTAGAITEAELLSAREMRRMNAEAFGWIGAIEACGGAFFYAKKRKAVAEEQARKSAE